MSDSASRLPARPSLEHLRKEAKDRLGALRAEKPGATLADAQFALAREYGFASWPKLVHHVETVNPSGLRWYEQLAQALAAAYTSGDFTAIREINWEHGTAFFWSRDVTRMHEQLPTWLASESRVPELALADARHLVARQPGFETWNELVQSLARPVKGARRPAIEAAFYRIDRERNAIEVRGLLSDQHWDTIVSVMREQGITALAAGGITDSVIERLSRLDQVTRLSVEGAQLTDDGVRHLARMSRLNDLTLGGPRSVITDRGLEVLRHLPSLRSFQMTWAPRVSDAGVANLKFCDELESVDLLGTPTGDGAIAALAGKRSLRRFKTGRLVSDAGLPLLHQLPVFKTWHGGEMKYSLMSADAEPTHLLLDGPITKKGVGAIGGLDGLFGLSFFWHTSALTPGALEALAHLPNLGMLGCEGQLCDDEAMRHIAAIPRLRMLMAQGTVASDEGFTALSRSRTIEYIWGRECPNLGGRGFAALASMPALRGLAVSCKNVDDASLAALPRFPSLRSFMPMDVRDDGFRHVGRCEQLEELWCMYCPETGDAATEHIEGLSKLRQYYAGDTRITDRSLEILGRMSSLESIMFWHTTGVTNDGVKALAALPRLCELTLEGLSRVTRDIIAAFPPRVRVNYAS